MSEAAKRMRQTHEVTGDKWFLRAAEEIERLEKARAELARHGARHMNERRKKRLESMVAEVLWEESGQGGVRFETQQRRFDVARAIVAALTATHRQGD